MHGIKRTRIAGCMALLLLPSPGWPQAGGQAEVALQGYYLAQQQQPLSDTTGLSMQFQEFLPHVGLLTGNLENYDSQGRWQLGENDLQLKGVAWQGYRWNFIGGDFRVPSLFTTNPFTNVFYPDLYLRGGAVQAERGNLTVTVFCSIQTMLQGPRIPFRISTGERVSGGSLLYRLSERLSVALRLLHLTADPNP